MRALVDNRTYRRLFLAQIVALIGTGLTSVALALLAYDMAGARAAEVLGAALALKMVVYVGVSPVVGAFTDRVPRRALMVAADLCRMGVVLALPFVNALWQVYVLIAVLYAAAAMFTPTFQSTLPDVLPDEGQYAKALSASQVAVALESIAGPLLAAGLLVVIDFHAMFGLSVIGFAISARLVGRTEIPPAERSGRSGLGERMAAGVHALVRRPSLRAVLALNVVVACAGSITLVCSVNVARDELGGGRSSVALLLAASGAGTIVAAAAAPALLRRRSGPRVLGLGAGISVVALAGSVGVGTGPTWAGVTVVWALIGAGTGLILVPVGHVIRAEVPAGDRPAAFAAQFALSHACWLVTYPVTGWVSTHGGMVTAWCVLAVAGAAAAGSAWVLARPPLVRHHHPEPVDPEHVRGAQREGRGWVHAHRVAADVGH